VEAALAAAFGVGPRRAPEGGGGPVPAEGLREDGDGRIGPAPHGQGRAGPRGRRPRPRVAAHWNAPEALDALAALAKDAEKPATDRFNAAAQLGLAAPIQLFCTNREPRVFETLTALAEDKNGQLKGVARMGLDGKLVAEGQGVKVKP